MSLFISPVTINNGTDHVLSFRSQLYDPSNKKSIIGVWSEDAAPISDESVMVAKHDTTSATVRRRLFQRKVNRPTITRGYRPITINLTAAYDVEHTSAMVNAEIAFIKGVLANAGFVANFTAGHI